MTDAAQEEVRYRAVLALELGSPSAGSALIEALSDSSWRVRKMAAERLVLLPDPPAVAGRLVAVLRRRGDPGARNAAAGALARIGAPAVPPVIDLLRDADPDLRKFAAEILGQLGSPAAEPALVSALADPDLNARAAAAEALGGVGGEEAVRALHQLLCAPEPLIRLCAVESLALLGRPPAMPALSPLLEDPRVRRAAFALLGQLPEPAAAERAARALTSESAAERDAGLVAVGHLWRYWPQGRAAELASAVGPVLHRLPAQALVREALASDDPEVARGGLVIAGILGDAQPLAEVAEAAVRPDLLDVAGWAMSRAGAGAARALLPELPSLSGAGRAFAEEVLIDASDPSWVPALCQALDSGDPDVAPFAVRALGRTRALDAVAPLVERIGDPQLGALAARGLELLGQSFAGPVLAALTEVLSRGADAEALKAAAAVGGARALPLLRRALRDPDPRARAAAAEAACELGGEECLDLARTGLADECPQVRAAAAKGLGRTAGAAGLLRVALGDADGGVRRAAIDAAGASGAKELAPELERVLATPDGLAAAQAVRALARLGRLGPAALEAAARHPDPEVLKEALRCAAPMPEAVRLGVDALWHPNWDVRADAARLLSASGGRECLDQVRAALEREPDAMVRSALEQAARRIGGR